MSCLCHKLLTEQYSNITKSEAGTLKKAFVEAPHLFQTAPPTPPDTETPALQAPRKRSTSNSGPHSMPDSRPRARKKPRVSSASSSTSLILTRSPNQSLQAITTSPLSSTATDLVRTYSSQSFLRVFGEGGVQLDIQRGPSSCWARIFLRIERIDQNAEIQQLVRRAYCTVFAQLHRKGTSVDPIVREIENALPLVHNTRQKVYNILRVGTRWMAIVEEFGSIVNLASQQLTGLLCLLSSASTWERASLEDCRSALEHLSGTTDICARTLQLTLLVGGILNQILLVNSFVDETRMLASHSKPLLGTMVASQPSPSSLEPAIAPASRHPSLVAASEAVPGSSSARSDDANMLLVLLCFLDPSAKIPLDILFRGASRRKRWNVQGEIEETDAIHAGLAPEVCSLLSDIPRLSNAFHELHMSSAVSKNSDEIYTLNEAIASRVRGSLPLDYFPFWKCQALIAVYRAIPWKYIESAVVNTKLFLPHLKHSLQAFQDCFEYLSTTTRIDLALTLVEASRFPKMEWKHFAIAQANIVIMGLENRYLRSRIAQAECLLYRIGGDMKKAVNAVNTLSKDGPSDSTDKRMHSALGLTAVQHALNYIQVEDLSMAEKSLESWRPVGQSASLMEEVVLFRKNMMLGRILRFGGRFKESLTHLELSRMATEQQKDLIFDEDLRDLACDLADTLRELEEPVSAVHYLRSAIGRRDPHCSHSPGRSLMELALAEALFAQGCYQEAEELCLCIESRSGLTKFEKLRLYITLAKLRHIVPDYEGAFSRWAQAMVAISKFPIETGGTTRIIIESICDIFSHQDQQQMLDESKRQVASLDELARPGSVWHWIAGLRQWREYLGRDGGPLRSHL